MLNTKLHSFHYQLLSRHIVALEINRNQQMAELNNGRTLWAAMFKLNLWQQCFLEILIQQLPLSIVK